MRNWLLILVTMFIVISCSRLEYPDSTQGIIEYDVIYLRNNSSMPTNLLPKKIILKFRGHKNITTIEGFMGMFSLSNISDFRKQINITMLKVMDNKLYYVGERNEVPFFFEYINNFELEYTDETKYFANLLCKKVIVKLIDSTHSSFDLYYTESIDIRNPNRLNPFSEIDGVLMAFNIHLKNIEMRVEASKYKQVTVENNVFEVPDNYIKISKRKIMSIMTKLLE